MGRMIGTAIVGMVFTAFIAVDLILFGVIDLSGPALVVALIIGLIGGGAGGWTVQRNRRRPAASA